MLGEREKKIITDRIKKFYRDLPLDFFGETKIFSARLAKSQRSDTFANKDSLTYQPVAENQIWGELWDSVWLKLEGDIPAEWAGKNVAFQLNVGGEALLFDPQGTALYSLTNTSVFASQYRKEIYQYTAKAQAEKLEFYLEVGANGLFGDELNPDNPAQKCDIGLIRHLKYGIFNREVWLLSLEYEVVMGLLNIPRSSDDCVFGSSAYSAQSYRGVRLLKALDRVVDVYGANAANAAKARAVLRPFLETRADCETMQVTAVGHSHIDTAWLWPVAETVRKCARTFTSQLRLMEDYPDYVFGASQAQLYAFTKEHYPELYQKIKERVREGRWELQGGMWVECDCNLVSGESLVRQFIHGKNFFRDEFGVDVKNLWLPDVFGYSAALPQIIRKSNCDYFLTQKISWNLYNKFPYHAFTWFGLDHTGVLSFFPPEDNYNAMLVPDQLNYGADNLTENYVLDEYLSLFGIGDGGGGPKEEFIERGLLCQDLAGSPKVKFGRADDFFDRLKAKQPQLPEWHGELYLELHRGTLTTQAAIKKANRRNEQLLTATEIALANFAPAASYGKAELDKSWKLLLLNQFHDIIPGSSIREVYCVALREHGEIAESCRQILDRAFADDGGRTQSLINTLSIPFDGLTDLPEGWRGAKGYPSFDGKIAVAIPPLGILTLERDDHAGLPVTASGELFLENDWMRYEFDRDGRLIHAFDKEVKREVLAGPANVISLYIDNPTMFDAWDIDLTYENGLEATAVSCKMPEKRQSPLGQSLNFELTVGQSVIRQTVLLDSQSKALRFDTAVDWRESKRMLRTAFPCNIVANEANFDIQYGFIKRPTHRNTDWDKAKFEVVGQFYADLSEHNYGAALLNDCKYGYKVHHNVIDLNLLRATSWPDAQADRGSHEFTYVFLPHTGKLEDSNVIAVAAMLNRPPLAVNGKVKAAPQVELVSCCNAALEVVKRAEKSDDLILRLVEKTGRDGKVKLRLANVRQLFECDLLEWHDGEEIGKDEQNSVEINLKPFEIKTIKCYI